MSAPSTILIVDQEIAIAELLVEVLAEAGYCAQMAFDSCTALATIARQPPALLLLDTRMPGMSAPMLLGQLREANLLQMPVVLMTTAPQEIPALRMADVSAVVAKPFDLNVLLGCVSHFVPQTPQNLEVGVDQNGNGVARW